MCQSVTIQNCCMLIPCMKLYNGNACIHVWETPNPEMESSWPAISSPVEQDFLGSHAIWRLFIETELRL